jgi:hypothetical protein
MSAQSSLLDPSIFSYLESKLEEETQVRDALTQIVQRLERSVASAQGLLSRVHSTPRSRCTPFSLPPSTAVTNPADPELVNQVENAVKEEVTIVKELSEVASKHPYYKFVALVPL